MHKNYNPLKVLQYLLPKTSVHINNKVSIHILEDNI